MSSKILGGLRRSVVVTLLAGAFVAAGAGVACADSIKAPDRGPVGPMTISGEAAGSDGAVTVTTDGTAVVISGRGHLESPIDNATAGVVHHDEDTGSPLRRGRDADLDSDLIGVAGGSTGDASSMDVVATVRIGAEKHYHVPAGQAVGKP
ncbi:hypothetical protein G5C66_05955 [Nocardioides sp. KC13]|uniref:DUF5666 domain-containing protein n=1 Tax=Nocardioides turkmenicus TaxID=2711220 RepID=A0A6M1QWK3_9ACTN|nr:hypothetical protein [Nocardioides sp. KC13]NGN92284.1 hypothetical protein [Nocardioides sp. KC13]